MVWHCCLRLQDFLDLRLQCFCLKALDQACGTLRAFQGLRLQGAGDFRLSGSRWQAQAAKPAAGGLKTQGCGFGLRA